METKLLPRSAELAAAELNQKLQNLLIERREIELELKNLNRLIYSYAKHLVMLTCPMKVGEVWEEVTSPRRRFLITKVEPNLQSLRPNFNQVHFEVWGRRMKPSGFLQKREKYLFIGLTSYRRVEEFRSETFSNV